MIKCYFLRHGIAADRDTWRGDDYERPLTGEGIERMKQEARALADFSLKVDLIVTSPLRRARETAEIVAKALRREKQVIEDVRAGPELGTTQLRQMLQEHDGVNSIMFVGHEPSMSETLSLLVGGAQLELKKGGMACIELDDVSVSRGTLLWLVPPKLLASRAPATHGLA